MQGFKQEKMTIETIIIRGDLLKKEKFLICYDEESAKKLSSNYKLINKNGNVYVFENNPVDLKFDFSGIDKTKFTYTNTLFF